VGVKDHIDDGCSMAARRRYGVQLAIKLISISHVKALNQLDQISLHTPQPVSRKHHSYNEINKSKIAEHVKTKEGLFGNGTTTAHSGLNSKYYQKVQK
jgi:hypothetical protein